MKTLIPLPAIVYVTLTIASIFTLDAHASVTAAPALAAPTPSPAPSVIPMAQPAPSNISSILSGNSIPLTLRLQDMNSTWRQFQVGAVEQGLSSLGAYMSVLSGGQNLGGEYFTESQTVTLGDTTYLVAYRLPAKQIDFSVILGQHADYTALPDVTTPNSIATLTLLNLKTIGALDNIHPFDMTAVIDESNQIRSELSYALGQRSDMDALTNLRELATSVLQEAKDHGDVIPAIQSPSALKRAIFKDVRVDANFLDPLTKRPFLANPSIVGHRVAEYSDASDIVMLYADAPGSDGMRAVAFLDGGTRMVDHNEWSKLQSTERLP